MVFGDYKKVIKKGHYVICDHCGDITLALKNKFGWWKYMYDKKNGCFTDFDTVRPYGYPGWHITKETVLCPRCYETSKLADDLKQLSPEDYSKLKELVKEVKNNS